MSYSTTIFCQKCNAAKIRTYDNQPLHHPDNAEVVESGDQPAFDSDVYSSAICDNCGHKFELVGTISYQQPPEIRKDETAIESPLVKKFFWKDKTGRGFTGNDIELPTILQSENAINYSGDELHEWAENAEEGDEWENTYEKYTCTEG